MIWRAFYWGFAAMISELLSLALGKPRAVEGHLTLNIGNALLKNLLQRPLVL